VQGCEHLRDFPNIQIEVPASSGICCKSPLQSITYARRCSSLPYLGFYNVSANKTYHSLTFTIQNVVLKMERKRHQDKLKAQQQLTGSDRESFDNIYLDLSKESGKCRFAETGFGWKPSGGGDTFTLDASNIGGAQWSRAAKGYEVKILQRNSGIVQLDGFQQEVRRALPCHWHLLTWA
jgi:hypothetical protein